MVNFFIYAMVYLGSALMVYNIIGFIRFARYIKGLKHWGKENRILYIPIVLLILFLIGYLVVGIFGSPDLIVSGILFGGSIFVFIIHLLLFGIARRIVKAERMEAQLMAAEESNRAKNDFLASISHEMRTPLNVILGLDTIALGQPGVPEQTKESLRKIGLSASHLLGLINNILDINRIETGKLVVHRQEFSLSDVLDQIGSIIETLGADKGLTYAESGRAQCAGRYVGDAMLVKQVLIALLDNAVKYTDAPGRVELKIASSTGPDGATLLRFDVVDTGVGMDPSFIPKVFDVFSREDTGSTSRHGGCGLGLAVTKKTVDLLGGEISVKSEKNVGSTFTVVLPFKKLAEETVPEGKEQALKSLSGRRVLIVEDIPENAEIVADLLDLEEVQTDHAENGRIGVEMFEKSPPGYYDAILMDLRMPVMDGLSAARAIRELSRPDAQEIPIIALTANAFANDIKQTMEAGMNAHLAKPADSDMLYDTLKKYIGQREDRKGGRTV